MQGSERLRTICSEAKHSDLSTTILYPRSTYLARSTWSEPSLAPATLHARLQLGGDRSCGYACDMWHRSVGSSLGRTRTLISEEQVQKASCSFDSFLFLLLFLFLAYEGSSTWEQTCGVDFRSWAKYMGELGGGPLGNGFIMVGLRYWHERHQSSLLHTLWCDECSVCCAKGHVVSPNASVSRKYSTWDTVTW